MDVICESSLEPGEELGVAGGVLVPEEDPLVSNLRIDRFVVD